MRTILQDVVDTQSESRVEKRLFFLINQAQHRMFSSVDRECSKRLGISVTQAAALLFVAKNEGCLQKELAGALGLNKPAVTGLANRMEKDLIIRKPCEQDGRATRLHLSDRGRELLPTIFPLIQTMNEKIIDDFSEEEIETVVRFLNRLKSNFE